MTPIRLGVVGAGLIWMRTHRQILLNMRDVFELTAFCDVSEERRAAVAQEFPNAQVVADHHRLFALPEVDTVLILTPIALNAPIALAALRAGKHVIMEKPIARSVAEGQTLAATARELGLRLWVTEQMAYRQAETTLAELISSRAIGDLIMWTRVAHFEGDTVQGALRYETTAWRKAADFPLGTLFDGGIHLIAGLSKVFGVPEYVSASGRQLQPEYGEYDHVAMMFHYRNGMVGMLSHSTYLPTLHNFFHIHGTAGVITVETDRFVVQALGQPPKTIPIPAENSYNSMWQALARALQANTEPYYTSQKAVNDVAILEMVDRSIKTGQRMPVPVD